MKFLLKWLYPYWKAHSGRMIFIIAVGMVSAVLETVNPILIKNIINGFTNNLNEAYILKNVFLILGTGLAMYITNMTAQRMRAYMNFIIEWEIRTKTYEHILKLDQNFFYKYTTGDLITRLVDDISQKISWFSCSGVFRFVQTVFTLIALVSVMLYMNPLLTLCVLLPIPLIVVFSIKGNRLLVFYYNNLQKSITAIYDFLEACLTGIKLIKANSKEESQKEYFNERTDAQRDAEIRAQRMDILYHYTFHGSGFIAVTIVYIVGGLMIIHGKSSLGELVAFQFYAGMITRPLFDISNFIVRGQRAAVSAKRVETLMENKPELTFTGKNGKIDGKISEIEFRNVSVLAPDKRTYLLKDINFKVKSGQRAAIVGKIGSGKSTLISLVLRLCEHSCGEILVNGTDIRDLDVKDYRARIGYTSQEAAIFTGSVRKNITLDRTDVTKEQINDAVCTAQLKKDLGKFKKGLDADAGTRGVSISGGQKQRISIARAVLRKPDILLLDDTTSAMDANTETDFWNGLRKSIPDVICLTATHRVHTIETSDLIIVLDNGKMAEKGTHTELLGKSSLYRDIYEQKKLEEELKIGKKNLSEAEQPAPL